MPKILVIEDEAAVRENIRDALELESFDVIAAANGDDGMRMAREHLPDLILCDVMMPERDGFAVLRALRHDSMTATIPFIFLTAKTARADRRAGMELGADDYLTKPFTHVELLRAIQTRLERHTAIETHRLRTLSHRLMLMHENERLQVARDLRDQASQIVTGLKITLESGTGPPVDTNRARLAEAVELVNQLAAMIDELAFELRPTALDDLGLLPALLEFFGRYSAQSRVAVRFKHAGLRRRFAPDNEIAAFRIIQEALTNVARHTTVNAADVQVWADDSALHIEVADQGAGFDLEAALLSGETVGLTRMQGRAMLLGGHLNIESSPHAGTRVYAMLPVTAPHETGMPAHETRITPAVHQAAHETVVPRPAPEAIGIVLADSHDLTRRGMRSLLEAEPGFALLGEVSHGREALDAVEQLQPDVLIADFALPGLNGIDIARYVARHAPQTRVLLLSLQTSEAYVLEALRSGATGYALKQAAARDLVQAVRDVAAGRRYLSPSLSERAIDAYVQLERDRESTPEGLGALTNREREILHLVVEGHTSPEIGERLSISTRTVETHRANIMRKLNVRNQAELVRYALQRGLNAPD